MYCNDLLCNYIFIIFVKFAWNLTIFSIVQWRLRKKGGHNPPMRICTMNLGTATINVFQNNYMFSIFVKLYHILTIFCV